jgi:hypothetical protein
MSRRKHFFIGFGLFLISIVDTIATVPTDNAPSVSTVSPTNLSSDSPSGQPSLQLSDTPSVVPYVLYSDVPSNVPSLSPSGFPSTYAPSYVPTITEQWLTTGNGNGLLSSYPSIVQTTTDSGAKQSDHPSQSPTDKGESSNTPSLLPAIFTADAVKGSSSNAPSTTLANIGRLSVLGQSSLVVCAECFC